MPEKGRFTWFGEMDIVRLIGTVLIVGPILLGVIGFMAYSCFGPEAGTPHP